MSNTRASIFEDDGDLDLSDSAPKPKNDVKAPPAAAVKAVAEKVNFKSRTRLFNNLPRGNPRSPQPSAPRVFIALDETYSST